MPLDKEPLVLDQDVEKGVKWTPDVEKGVNWTPDVEKGIVDDFAYKNNVANASVQIRLGFLRKVYSLLTFQLMLTVIVCGVCMFNTTAQFFIRNNHFMLTFAFIASFAILIALFFKRKHHPINLILLAAFTIIQTYTVAVIITYYDQIAVLKALFLTLAIQIGLTLFTLQSKRDFSIIGASLFAGVGILIVGEILHLFFGGTVLGFTLTLGGALVFSLFIIYDTHMIMHKLSPEEYILATITLYLDIINLFGYVLRMVGETRRN